MGSRRSFIKRVGLASMSSPFIYQCMPDFDSSDYWAEIKALYYTAESSPILNFNTGSAGLMPTPIKDAYLSNIEAVNSHAPYEVKSANQPLIDDSMTRLASVAGCKSKNLALVRNTTEAINAVLYGKEWKAGDEVIVANVDYPSVLNTLNHIATQKGIKLITVNIDCSVDGPSDIVAKYEKAVTTKTKLILITYVTHRLGFIMPAQSISKMARSKKVQTLIDAAHALGQINHSISELSCDYYATSLHKWMYAPLGSGLLYIRQELIPTISPPNSFALALGNEMDKFTNLGTLNFAKAMTLGAVLDFSESIGISRKYDRLKYLQAYLLNGLRQIKRIEILGQDEYGCGIVTFSLSKESRNGQMVVKALAKSNIHAKSVSTKMFSATRITLNLHLDEADVDRLLIAVKEIASA